MPIRDEITPHRVSVDERLPPHADEEETLVPGVREHEHGEADHDAEQGAAQQQQHDVARRAAVATHLEQFLDTF